MFSVLLTIISSLIACLELSIALVHMNIVRQRTRNNFRQSLMSKDTRTAGLICRSRVAGCRSQVAGCRSRVAGRGLQVK